MDSDRWQGWMWAFVITLTVLTLFGCAEGRGEWVGPTVSWLSLLGFIGRF